VAMLRGHRTRPAQLSLSHKLNRYSIKAERRLMNYSHKKTIYSVYFNLCGDGASPPL
jgi:hypothetical protein